MDTRYLGSLIEVVERGSIAEAARAQHLTAAAVSQRIQALERAFGFTLLSRAGHMARPTDACLNLLPRARHIVREMELIAGDVDPSGLTGSLRLGVISTALTGLVPQMLVDFTSKAPQARLRVMPGTSEELYRALLNREIQAAILVMPEFDVPASVSMMPLRKERLVLLSKQKPEKGIARILRERPYIRYDKHAWGGRFAEAYLADRGIDIEAMLDLDALEAITLLVDKDVGVSLIPEYAGLSRWSEHCAITPIRGGRFAREIAFATLAPSESPRLVEVLLEVLRRCATAEAGPDRLTA